MHITWRRSPMAYAGSNRAFLRSWRRKRRWKRRREPVTRALARTQRFAMRGGLVGAKNPRWGGYAARRRVEVGEGSGGAGPGAGHPPEGGGPPFERPPRGVLGSRRERRG